MEALTGTFHCINDTKRGRKLENLEYTKKQQCIINDTLLVMHTCGSEKLKDRATCGDERYLNDPLMRESLSQVYGSSTSEVCASLNLQLPIICRPLVRERNCGLTNLKIIQ